MTDPLQQQLRDALGVAYTITRELSGGGMSRVFLAEEVALNRRVVVKVLPPETAAAMSSERFRREIALAARLQHPHIVPLLTAGEAQGLPYFTMPFVEGESLRVRLARHGELPVAEAIRLLREVASALQYAHERGVVHRDIKPDNVLLSGGSAMVTDFGIAKAISASSQDEGTPTHSGHTSHGVALGTPTYMSPEQASADPTVDHRADLYAFGVLAYEALTGQPPFAGRTPQGLLAAHITETPQSIQTRRANLPSGLALLVMRCLEKRPADRPQTAAEIVHALDEVTPPSGGTPPVSVASVATAPNVSSRRYRLAIALGAAAVVAISAVAVWRQRSASSGADSVSRSIAVLPLVNASGDTATQYFVDGMTDELTNALGRVSGLRVASRSAAGSIDTRHSVDPKQAGQRLHVGAVLEGRVRKDGTRLRLAMQLTNAEDGLSLWSESYEREVTDAFAVQDDVARAIASALSVRLAGAPPASSHGTANPEAHDLVLRARYQISLYTEPSLHQAISLLDRAVTLDSTYADAWAGLADAWGRLGDDFLPAKDALVHVRPALARALKLDSLNPNVLAQLATVQFFYDRAVPSADRTFRRVLAQDPSNENAVTYAWLLLTDGKKDSAAAVIARLAQLDPLNRLLAAGAPMKLASAGRIQAANEACRRATELDSLAFSGCRLDVRYFSGHAEQNLVDPICIEAPWCIPEMLGRLGRTKEAQRGAVTADTRMTGRGYLNPAVPARMWADVGNADSAMAWLARVEHNQGAQLALLTWEPAFASLHRDPRFQALVKRSGLR